MIKVSFKIKNKKPNIIFSITSQYPIMPSPNILKDLFGFWWPKISPHLVSGREIRSVSAHLGGGSTLAE